MTPQLLSAERRPAASPRWRALASSLGAGAAMLLCAGARAAPAVYGESAMVKIRPSTPPHDDRGVGLSAARNEFVSFQVVIHGGDAGAKAVRATLSGLVGPGRIGGGDITLYREALLDIAQPSTSDSQPGPWPDGLVPDVDEIAGEPRQAFPFDVPAGEARAIWVDVHVPAGVPAGLYQGAVQVSGDRLSARVAVSLTVLDVDMPSTPSLRTAFLLYAPNVCLAHTGSSDCGGSDKAAALVARYERMALEHRITLPNIFTLGNQGGDWSAFDQAYAPFLDGTAPSRLPGAKMTTAQYMGGRDVASYAAFAQHFRAKGWFDRAYDYTADEPPAGSSFEDAYNRASMAKQADPDFRTLVTTTIDEAQAHGLGGLLDIIVPVVNFIDAAQPPYQGDQRGAYDAFLEQPGKSLWLYQSCMSHGCGSYWSDVPEDQPGAGWPSYMVDTPASKNRAMQWVDFEERASGELYYETAMALPSAWTDQARFGGDGDGTLFYPGTPSIIGGSTDVPVASIRLKLIRQGVQDYEWLKMVSDAGDPGFAQATARAVVPAAYQVGDDGAVYESARLELAKRLLQLLHKDWPSGGAHSGGGPVTSSPSGGAQSGGTLGGRHKSGGCASGPGTAGLGGALLALAGLALAARRRR